MGIEQISSPVSAPPAGNGVKTSAGVNAPRPQSAPAPQADATPSSDEVEKAVEALNSSLQPVTGSIEFSIDQDSGQTLLKVVDRQTNTLLLQIPSKQALELQKNLGKMQGVLLKEKI